MTINELVNVAVPLSSALRLSLWVLSFSCVQVFDQN